MKWAAGILVVVIVGAAAAFWWLDAGTAVMVVFAIVAAGFFGSLPWVISGLMDRGKKKGLGEGARVVRGFEEKNE